MKKSESHTEVAPIEGWVAAGFEPVRAAFAENFSSRGKLREQGAALSVYRAGIQVVDLWGGYADAAGERAWRRDTVCNVYSATKGVMAVALALLVDAGLLDYTEAVGTYWPDYACNGKEATTVAQLLSHQAGLPGFRQPMAIADLYDWERCCRLLAGQQPLHEPGAGTCYHAMTWGFLAGELLRRVSGMMPREFVRQRLAGPLAAPVSIGLPAAAAALAADILPPESDRNLSAQELPEAVRMALCNPELDPAVPNTAQWRAAQLPAANGFMSADGLARVYAALANDGLIDDITLLSRGVIGELLRIQSERQDALLGFEGNWALGLSFNCDGMLGPHPRTFGHSGWGGSFGCANMELGLGVGYVCNRMGEDLVGDPRTRGLCEAIFGCVG